MAEKRPNVILQMLKDNRARVLQKIKNLKLELKEEEQLLQDYNELLKDR